MTRSKKGEDEILFIDSVLQHYYKYGRKDLLWRKNITPYRILVSEIMLQQTQVKRVLPKFNEWMTYYPTLKKLKSATLKEVLLIWQGLGYQRRAKALFAISQRVEKIPKSFDELLLLPGIGVYTASAISAFAYNIFSHPVLETNIRTALIEYFHQGGTEIQDRLLYNDLLRLEKQRKVQGVGAREWYYALMDYGAYLKENNISHNKKSAHYKRQSSFKGSLRELRAKVLFTIIQDEEMPNDSRLVIVLNQLMKEGYIKKTGKKFLIT